MPRSIRICLAAALAVLASAETRRPIAETDLYSFRWIASPQISPDGSKVVYTLVTVNAKHDGYDTALWIVSTTGGAARQFTAGPRDTGPRWSPDGRMLAFLRAPEQKESKEGKPHPSQIWLLSMDGGEARPLTDMPKGASAIAWAPNGQSIAFLSTTRAADFEKKKNGQEEESDVRVIVRAAYRMNGQGYFEPDRPSHILTVPVPIPNAPAGPEKATQVTTGAFSESDIVWSRDGLKIYFTSNRVREPYYEPPHDEIYVVGAAGREIAKVAGIDGPIRALSLSLDGRRMAFVGSIVHGPDGRQRSYSQPDLFVTPLDPGSVPRNLTADYDFDIGGSVGGDQAPPRGAAPSKPFWSADSRSTFVTAAEEGSVNLKRVDVETGKLRGILDDRHNILSYSATPDGAHLVLLVSTPTVIGDLYLMNGAPGGIRQLTHVNADLFNKIRATEPEMIWYKSFDGRRIQAWVQRRPIFRRERSIR